MTSPAAETALLLTVPAADPVVEPQRRLLDRAASAGVPAHVTVLYPFAPSPDPATLARVGEVAASVPAFTLRFEETAWFGEDVVFLVPRPADPVRRLMAALEAAFPDLPPYGGAHDEQVPHLTVAHDAPLERLQVAEAAVGRQLPVEQEVTVLSLWGGPPLLTGEQGWRQLAAFPLG